MKNFNLILLTAFFLCFIACRKDDSVPNATNNITTTPSVAKTIADSAVNIINPSNKAVVFCWIDTIHMGKCPGYFFRDSVVVQPHDTVKIPTSHFCDNFACSYWYYSYDMTINNWHSANNYPYHRTAFGGKLNSKIVISITDTANTYLQRCVGTWYNYMTKWYAADAYSATGVSVWSTLTTAEKNQTVDIWSRGGFRFIGFVAGKVDSASFRFPDIANPLAFKIDMKSNEYGLTSAVTQFLLTDKLATTIPISTLALDTMFMTINSAPPYYKIYRKP